MDFATLRHCTELRDAHIIAAVKSSEAMEALLARFVELAGPGKGAPILLAALARLGTTECDWIDGELRIEIVGDDKQTTIGVSSSIGAGFREKLFPDTVLRVPLEEFSRGIKRAPRLIEPLQVKESAKRIVMTITQEVRRTSMPPPMVEIDPASLMVVNVIPLMPRMAVPTDVPSNVMPMAPRRPAGATEGAPKVILRKRAKPGDPEPEK